MEIYVEDEQVVDGEILAIMEKAAKRCLFFEKIDDARTEISVSFVNKEEIQKLNRAYRDNDKVTDVLSFPQFVDLHDIPQVGEICLGDVVICQDKAMEQAEELGHSFRREIIYLFTHSILHLLGYDHMNEVEKRAMRCREEEVMEYLEMPRC